MQRDTEQPPALRNGSGTPSEGLGPAAAPANPLDDVVMAELARAIRSIEFGSVLVKIHQGEVVGIETSTKVRLAQSRRANGDG